MSLTGSQIVDEVCDIVGKKVTAVSVSGQSLQTRVLRFVNWGQRRIARMHSFHELNQLYTGASLVADQKRYHWTSDLGLTRPKDIFDIRLIDGENSRKIERWNPRRFDRIYPRPENYTTGRPKIYIRWGPYLEFFKIPDDSYPLYIRYPQWASELTLDGTSDFENKDKLLIIAGVLETYLALQENAEAGVWYKYFLDEMKRCTHGEGNVDWEPEAEAHGEEGYKSGQPWRDPYALPGDPLWNYPE
mgnify:CR=1 FL=1